MIISNSNIVLALINDKCIGKLVPSDQSILITIQKAEGSNAIVINANDY